MTNQQTPGEQMPGEQTDAERKLAELIVAALQLEIAPTEIEPEAALFGDGLGLDSIDALELALAISRAHGIELRSDDQQNRRIFASLRSLSAHIEASRAAATPP
ncbi:acyl carrier protein [Siccirubricoccus sp. G192]|nr:acyl carrier protein [Siccirubricoccus sp. G192]MBV1800284.1 acyl carrier protein [Siccirubricoccus sp. G192]